LISQDAHYLAVIVHVMKEQDFFKGAS